ncbi:MAG: TrbI/VirB10 family protein, partial [Jaaginema sp. PMC 1079.18]|nr:TrbI/VirB10 family protein [Jaaginema sp. PMC 1079.18]
IMKTENNTDIDFQDLPSPEAENTQWTTEKLAEFVGLSDRIHSEQEEDNVIQTSEFFEDPHDHKSQRGFADNPWSKVGLVYGVVGIGALVFGYFLTQIFAGNSSQIAETETPETSETVVFDEAPNSEVGRLKTELALSEQAERMQEIEQGRSPQTSLTLSEPEPESESDNETERSPTPPRRPVQSTSSSGRAIASNPPRSVPPRSVPRRTSISRPRQPPSTTSPPKPIVNPTPRSEPFDPNERLAMLQSYGVYTRQLEPEANSSSLRTATSENPRLGAISRQNEVPTALVASSDLTADEAAIMTGNPVQAPTSLEVGSRAEAVLVTPIAWAEGLEGEEMPQFVVALAEDWVNADGETVLKAGTELVFVLEQIHASGLVIADATTLILPDGSEQALPPGAITLNGSQGAPLAADLIQLGEDEIARRDLQVALFGALGNLGQVLNRPEQESRFSTSSTFGESSQTLVRNGSPNWAGALLEGGFSTLVEQNIERNQTQIEALRDRPALWYLEAGHPVEILVNRSF